MRPTSAPSVRPAVPTWVRAVLVVLGAPNVVAGLWAVAAPEHWFERFPGWDPRLVAAEPPYNAHLASDAGAGLLASGAVLLAAAWLADRRSVLLGVLAFAAFTVPHALYHGLNPAPGLSAAEDAQAIGALVASVVAAAAVAVAVVRHGDGRVRREHRRQREEAEQQEALT